MYLQMPLPELTLLENDYMQRETTSLVDVNDKLNKKVHIMEGMYRQVDGELWAWPMKSMKIADAILAPITGSKMELLCECVLNLPAH